jgi:resolvase-like protein/Lon protease-like protein
MAFRVWNTLVRFANRVRVALCGERCRASRFLEAKLSAVEVTIVPGRGKLMITGRLGEVMQESAQAALSYDGGFSGAGMVRPGLQQLLANIREGLVDTVVVYKVDRLTRSLTDFATMVELFDAKGVSFVAVTQQFNTTTSMGRLTLNVLLSFAQFEREVIGERIRDKVAGSKRKGI